MYKTKLATHAVLLLAAISGAAIAAGSHSGHHDEMMTTSEMQGEQHMMKMDNTMAHSAHNMGHDDHSVSSVGQPGLASAVNKTIKVVAKDSMRFEFATAPELKAGDVVKFAVSNEGKIVHAFSIGDAKEQAAHNAMMKKMPNMVHQDGNTITLKPGETKTIIWKFTGHNEVVFACNIPGHAEAGMIYKTVIK